MSVSLRARAATTGWTSLVREYRPTTRTARHVAATWEGEPGRDGWLRLLPDGCVDVWWDGEALGVTWAGEQPLRVRLRAAVPSVGVRLRCGTAAAVLSGAVWDQPGRSIPVADLLGGRAGVSEVEQRLRTAGGPARRRAVLEQWIGDRTAAGAGGSGAAEPRLAAVVGSLGVPGARVPDVASTVGLGERTVRRQIRAAVGLGPKSLHRVLRFQAFLARLEHVLAGRESLAAAAARVGYVDQAHLGHECRRLSGSTPAELLVAYRRAGPGHGRIPQDQDAGGGDAGAVTSRRPSRRSA
ncbi:helix-turn-helix domain-containing protein [Pseudonocardia humida]|uniref:Helix-turn-helix domain-containing protein n=1 Tax=Pseudonocardia humida TaxID=2800819 RepID=A0ABT1A018_9PSEU|nr:helix-turn-helix domain-containing protein [Pseudonocardia humida]MCO1656350.1 helix-turn-helix domain-containing protein [Pseudonocardia humida]